MAKYGSAVVSQSENAAQEKSGVMTKYGHEKERSQSECRGSNPEGLKVGRKRRGGGKKRGGGRSTLA